MISASIASMHSVYGIYSSPCAHLVVVESAAAPQPASERASSAARARWERLQSPAACAASADASVAREGPSEVTLRPVESLPAHNLLVYTGRPGCGPNHERNARAVQPKKKEEEECYRLDLYKP